MSYEVARLGTSQHANWSCLHCAAVRRRRTGQDHDEFRGTAATHVRVTGHAVTLFRGTEELLAALNTGMPAPQAITTGDGNA
jgi:hypothetical protein